MSLVSFVGPKPNLLNTTDINPPIRLEVSQPVLTATDMEKLRHIHKYTSGKLSSFELDICYPVAWGKDGVEARLASLAADAEDAVRSGANILIVSDRKLDETHVAIPALLATSAIHQHLVKKGLRTSSGLVVETGSARETHHFALLGGCGAEAVHPYLALEPIEALAKGDAEKTDKYVKNYVIHSYFHASTEVYLCGGGAHNARPVNRISEALLEKKVALTDQLGIDVDWVEAFAFAWLARQAIHKNTSNLPAVTGAKGERILGAIFPS